MYRGLAPERDRRFTWRSVTAGIVLNVAIFGLLVAASHPLATGVAVVAGTGLYVLRRVLQRASYERSVRFCRAGVCLRLELCVG